MIDLRSCEKGDILISSHGAILEYISPTEPDDYMDHKVRYIKDKDGKSFGYECYGTRTHDGFVYRKKRIPEVDHDIVKIVKKNKMKKFPNGFKSWQETHFEVVSYITDLRYKSPIKSNVIEEIQLRQGTSGFYELAEELTDEFENLNEGREWDGEFFDEIEDFLEKKLLC